jgi:hypothetical protein
MENTTMPRKALLAVLLALGCGSESPANVAGTYTLALTVQQTDCGILNGAVGDTSSGTQVVITQTGADVTCQLQGAAGILFAVAFGTDTFTGKVAGNSLDMSIAGTMPGSSGTCAFTRNAHLQAKLSGDTLTGSVTYTFATNKTADCGTQDTCKDIQAFNGTRPPSVSP